MRPQPLNFRPIKRRKISSEGFRRPIRRKNRKISQFTELSVYQHFIIIIISAIFFPVCEMAHFALQYRPYHHTKSTESRPDMVVFATRKSPFRKTEAL